MDNEILSIPISDVKIRDDLYPRIEHDVYTVEKYVSVVDKLPPIEVNQHYELIDGKHRLLAHRTEGRDTINALVTETQSDAELLKLAVIRNATHGKQLSAKDKKATAIKMYLGVVDKERAELKKELPGMFGVGKTTVHSWTRDIDQKSKEEMNERIHDMWLACNTGQVIADATGLTEKSVRNILEKFRIFGTSVKNPKFSDFSEEGFSPPIYNVWAWSKKADGILHNGNTDPRVVENLLWLYTEPFDIFVDPFAGGGSTIDICKKRLRRYYVSDLTPIVAREHEIRQHDILLGMPRIPSWKDVKVVYLDPPYWKQAVGKYDDDNPSNLANMDLDTFHDSMVSIINQFTEKLSDGAKIALIIQPTAMYPNRDEGVFNDHVIEIAKRIDLRICNRIQAPYPTQQHLPQNVEWAKENHRDLVISRELIIWEK